jgi:hypothetical protein
MLLWQLVLRLTAAETKNYCHHESTLFFHPLFRAVLDPLCRWPAPEAKSALKPFWLAVMGYDAPESEFEAWERFALGSSYAGKGANEALPALFFAIVYNPYFLLRK